jgi:hypothetical protein
MNERIPGAMFEMDGNTVASLTGSLPSHHGRASPNAVQ